MPSDTRSSTMDKVGDVLDWGFTSSPGQDKDYDEYMKGEGKAQQERNLRDVDYRRSTQRWEDYQKYGKRPGYQTSRTLTGTYKPVGKKRTASKRSTKK